MHHKRKKPKNARAGCLMCKSHKANGCSKEIQMKFGNRRHYEATKYQLKCE